MATPAGPGGPTGPSGPTGPTNVGVAPNVGGLLCYAPCCIGFVFSIVVVIIEKQSRFLRFHAFQSLLFHAVLFVLGFGLNVLFMVVGHIVPIVGGLLGLAVQGILFVVAVVGTILLMMKAYNGEEYELPTLGALAKQWV